MAKKNYFDFSLFDEVGDAMDLFANNIRNAFEFDAFAGKDLFEAVVLTQPIPMSEGQIAAFVVRQEIGLDTGTTIGNLFKGENADDKIRNYVKTMVNDDIPRFTFKARIIGLDSPHLFLPDPCNMEVVKDSKQQRNIQDIIDMHTTVIANNATSTPKIGDLVKIRIEQGTFSVNPQNAQYVELITSESKAVKNTLARGNTALEENCADLIREAFGDYSGQTVGSVQKALLEAIYVGVEPNIRVKNGELIENKINLVSPPQEFYNTKRHRPKFIVQALGSFIGLATAYKEHFKRPISISDSYRDYDGQIKQRKEKGTGAAVPGTSNHGWGVAIDIDGTRIVGKRTLDPEHPATNDLRFESEVYKWMADNAPRFGWDQPAALKRDGDNPEAWHWENIQIRDQFFIDVDEVEIPPTAEPDASESPPEGNS